MDKISVIIPVYKVENYLERCVRSVCNQTYPELEILLIDDGSPDRSGEICDVLAGQDARIRVIHKSNGGLSDARNTGMDAATGAYLAFVDSDDWIDPFMLELLHRLCCEYNVGLAECSYRNIYLDCIKEETTCSGKIIRATAAEAIEGNLDWKLFKPVAWNKLYRAEITKNIRFPVGKLHEDEFTTHKFYIEAKDVIYADVSAYNYDRSREDSITAKFHAKNLDACQAFHEKMHLVLETPALSSILGKLCNVYCYTLFSSLEKCVNAGIMGKELERTVKDALEDRTILEKQSIEDCYRRALDALDEKGVKASVQAWRGK